VQHAGDRQEPVAEVRLRRRAHADPCACRGEEVELAAVGMRRVHDRRPRAETAGLVEQLDRPLAGLGGAFFDLARLLVGMHVERQVVCRRVGAQLAERVGRAGADGVRGDPDADVLCA
jgi:hypothetical protein